MAALEEDFKHGFNCQKTVVNNLNKLFARNGSGLVAEETDEKTDMCDKYDIRILDKDGHDTKLKFDVKSAANMKTGNISYSVLDNNGKSKPTNSKEENKLGIRLIFVFDNSASTMYFPNMDKWYELLKTLPVKKGRIYVLKNENGKVVPEYAIRQGNRVSLKDYYDVTTVVKDMAGDQITSYTARVCINHKKIDVELEYDRFKDKWYFEGGSEYVVVSRSQIQSICDPTGIVQV